MTENTELMEQTIPEEDVEMDEGFLDVDEEVDEMDYWVSDEEEAAAEENSEVETADGEQAEQESDEQTSEEEMFPHELVVYGEKKQVTMTEAKNLIQKGLAYDRAIETRDSRLQTALNDPRIAFVDELAKEAGVDAAQYMSNIHNQKKYATLIENFGTLENVPKDVLQMFSDNAKAASEKAAATLQEMREAEEERARQEEFAAFMEKHPECGQIPPEVVQLKLEGHSLEGAWAIYENKQLKESKEKLEKELAVLKQNNKNARSKMPSSQSTAKKETGLEWDFD